jgi:Sugar-specific transcriptional regulator TrmB
MLEDLKKILLKLNFSSVESDVFSVCHEYGPQSMTTISRLLHKPKSTLYGVVRQMVAAWKIYEIITTNWSKFQTPSYSQLMESIIWIKVWVQEQIDFLAQHHDIFDQKSSLSTDIPFITYYNKKEVLDIIYEKIISAPVMCSIWDIENGMKSYGVTLEFLMKHSGQNNWITRQLLIDSEHARYFKSVMQREWHDIKIITNDKLMRADILLMHDKFYQISYGPHIIWCEISDPTFVQIQQVMFDTLRDSIA